MRLGKNWAGKLIVALVLIGLMVTTSGCGAAKALSNLRDKFAGKEQLPAQNSGQNSVAPVIPEVTTGDTMKVVLYFTDPQSETLVAQERIIPKEVGIARAAIKELIKGPTPESGLLPTIPAGTQLKDINIKPDGLAIVDFSKELVTNHPGGSANEELTVYSIVNTLTQFPSVKKVQFLVEGQYVDTIASHMDISTTLSRNEGLISTQKK